MFWKNVKKNGAIDLNLTEFVITKPKLFIGTAVNGELKTHYTSGWTVNISAPFTRRLDVESRISNPQSLQAND
jgi:hypothetical protein